MTNTETPRRSLPVWQWPSRDRTAWSIACDPCDPFDASRGRASVWRASTRHVYQVAYGRFLGRLEEIGELDRGAAPEDRATEECVRAFCQSLYDEGRAPYTIASNLMGLSRVLHAMVPGGDFGWISIAARRIHGAARPVKDLRDRMQPVEDVLKLAYDLMWEAEHGRFRTPFQNAAMFRDGLFIALLVHRPLRVGNLSAIQIGRHLEHVGDGWRLSFSAAEMKAGRPHACSWPEELEELLEHYLEVHRKVLMDEHGEAPHSGPLWISRESRAMTISDNRMRVMKWTGEEFGTAINPHALRHMAATTIATDHPEGVAGIAPVLGHASLATSEKHYNLAKQVDAASRYQDVVMAARRRRRRGRGRKEGLH